MLSRKTRLFLLAIICLGAILRLYKLDKFPPSLFGDELDVGYQAYSILKTGKDYYSQPWPISFHSISDWRTPLLLYSTVPFVAIFGLNEWGVRLPSAIFGILAIPSLFLLVRKLFKNDDLALLSAFGLSVSMWHLQYSRAAFEVSQMLLLLILGIYFFFKGLERWKFLILSAVFLVLTPYSYNTAKFFLPIIILVLFFAFRSQILRVEWKKLTVVLSVFVILGLPMAVDIFRGQGGQRFSILSIFTDPVTVPEIGFARQVDMNLSGTEVVIGMSPSLSSRIFHNKFLVWATTFLRNYFKAFSTEFLFTFGDINYRHSVQGGFGEFNWLDVIFLLSGFYFLLRARETSVKKLIFGWLLLAPIPSALTRDGGNHATRLILMLPPLLILAGFGVYNIIGLVKKIKRKVMVSLLFFILYSLFFVLYLHRYYLHYPLDSEEWWHFGYKEMAQSVKKFEKEVDFVVISDQDQPPLIYTLFWLKIDPEIAQNGMKLKWTKLSDAIQADNLPGTKYYFGHIDKDRLRSGGVDGALKPNILYLCPQSEIRSDYRYSPVPVSIELLDTIFYPSGRSAKYVLRGK